MHIDNPTPKGEISGLLDEVDSPVARLHHPTSELGYIDIISNRNPQHAFKERYRLRDRRK